MDIMADSEDEVEYEPEEFELDYIKLSVMTISFMPLSKLLNCQTNQVEISGQKLWCGSLCLVNRFYQHPIDLSNTALIELGAGTGVVSMVASKLGAGLVISTDHDQRSLDHMNIDKVTNNTPIAVERLDWFNPVINKIREAIDNSEASKVQIVAGDVLYKFTLLQPFFNTILAIIQCYPTAELLLCHVPRAGVDHSDVRAAAEQNGLAVNELPAFTMQESLARYCPEEDLQRARLYIIQKT